jgi:hypothetical protein
LISKADLLAARLQLPQGGDKKMKQKVLIGAVFLSALMAQEKYTAKIPDGLAVSEFRGYESWQYVASSVTDDRMKIIGGNPVMIAAYKDGIPGNGKPVPDGAVITKVQWSKKPSPEFPKTATVPAELKEVEFMVKDSKRFPDSHGWGYAEFTVDASGAFKPFGTGTKCGAACHNSASKKDYVFTEYSLR